MLGSNFEEYTESNIILIILIPSGPTHFSFGIQVADILNGAEWRSHSAPFLMPDKYMYNEY